jgi:RNA polymerase sigma-70 factor, ECF subfamily
MNGQNDNEEFYCRLVDAQRTLYAYILRLLPNAADANDVLQETNMVLMRRRNDFRPGAEFVAWAAGVARFQVLAFRRDAGRQRLVFGEPLLDQLAAREAVKADTLDAMFTALERCRAKLSAADCRLLDSRYGENLSVTEIAERDGRSPRAISQALYRIRVLLLDCIQQVVRSQENENG